MKHHDWSNLQKDEILFIYGSRKFGCTMVGTVGRHTWHQLQEAERSPLQLQAWTGKERKGGLDFEISMLPATYFIQQGHS